MKTLCEKPRLRRLLDHFSAVTDPREQWQVAYPLPEVLLLVVCGTIASCDDYDDIVDSGEAHLAFLRRFRPYSHGAPPRGWPPPREEPGGPGGFRPLLREGGAEALPGRAKLGPHGGKA